MNLFDFHSLPLASDVLFWSFLLSFLFQRDLSSSHDRAKTPLTLSLSLFRRLVAWCKSIAKMLGCRSTWAAGFSEEMRDEKTKGLLGMNQQQTRETLLFDRSLVVGR